jgi:hypothetical protein
MTKTGRRRGFAGVEIFVGEDTSWGTQSIYKSALTSL